MDKYSFNSDAEPTDEQLEALMACVLEDVKERAAKADAQFKALQAQQIQKDQQNWDLKYTKNGKK